VNSIDVGIVSHSPIFAAGIRAVLDRDIGARVIILNSPSSNWPPVATVIIESDNLNQIESTLMICRLSNPEVKSAVFLSPLTLHLAASVMKLGVNILLDKTQGCEQLSHLLRAVLSAECVMVSQSFWTAILPDNLSINHYSIGLTRREFEVLALIDQNYSNTEIAEVLQISVHTVKRHVEHLLRKLNATDRHHCARIAHQVGILHKTRAPLPA
jgi:DNA-binding NarL/FixJ family response regulator